MKIVDMYNKPLRACVQFNYKGYIISVSNVVIGWVEVAVMDDNDPQFFKNFPSVEDAVIFINNKVKQSYL